MLSWRANFGCGSGALRLLSESSSKLLILLEEERFIFCYLPVEDGQGGSALNLQPSLSREIFFTKRLI